MLRLSRKKGQQIKLYLPPDSNGHSECVTIEVTRANSTIGLGIDAPKNVSVVRAELEEEQPCQR